MIKKLELHLLAVLNLLKITFMHIRISMPKISTPMSKLAYITGSFRRNMLLHTHMPTHVQERLEV